MKLLPNALVRSAAWAAAMLVDPNQLVGWRKSAYWLALGAATALDISTGHDDDVPPGLNAGIGVAAGGLVYGTQEGLAKSDAWAVRQAQRLGAKHPRRWLAGVTFAAMLASWWLTNQTKHSASAVELDTDELYQPMPEAAKALISKLLDAVEGYGSAELRAQLHEARSFQETQLLSIRVADSTPRTLADRYTFPAVGFIDGAPSVFLEVAEGRLEYVWLPGVCCAEAELPEVSSMEVRVGPAAWQ